MTLSLTIRVACLSLHLAFALAATGASTPTKQELVLGLAQHEERVRSIHCRYTVNASVTNDVMRSRIAEVLRTRGMENEVGKFLTDPKRAQRSSYAVEWWGKGVKERWHTTNSYNPRTPETLAFDGRVVRTVGVNGRASITTPETIGMDASGRPSPMNLLYTYAGKKWSQLVSLSPKVEIVSHAKVSSGRLEVTFNNFRDAEIIKSFQMNFDELGRLVERKKIGCFGGRDSQPRLVEYVEFDDYRACKDETGQTIWFPFRVDFHQCVGQTADGLPAVWKAARMTIQEIEFNTVIEDSFFIPELPTGAVIRDEITGVGMITTENAAAAWKGPDPDVKGQSIQWYHVLVCAECALAICLGAMLARLLWKRSGVAS